MIGKNTRRRFLKLSASAMAAGVTSVRLSKAVAKATDATRAHPIRIGGPVFGVANDPEELAQAHKKLGYGAAYCPSVDLNDTDRIRAIREAFSRTDVVIAEVGRWVNLLDADPARRAANLKTVTEGLALAEAVGARCCVDIAGSYSKENWFGPHPKNLSQEFFDATVENARKIIDAVKPKRAKFTLEVMGWALPDSVESYLKLIRAIDRKGFGVHLDPCNMINSPRRFYDNTGLLNKCFDKLGPWIVSCHAKDLTWDVEMNVHFREVCLGTGSLDYTTYLKRLATLPGDVPLMIEHMQGPEEYDRSRRYLLDLGKKIGIRFG